MAEIKKHRPKSFAELLKQIETFQNNREISWYRGAGDISYSLIPSLFRNPQKLTAEGFNEIERGINNRFAQRSPPFVNFTFANEWKMLFYMQHYGIPTRLLDWTESPFVGLYFALTSVARNKKGNPSSDVALWLCDPIAWNRAALSHISFKGGVLDESCEEIKAYSPSSEVDQRATLPIMIYGTHNSPRIVAQRGVFALFGKGISGMEKIFIERKFPAAAMEQIIIEKTVIEPILGSLYRKGFAESTIYPDLVGLSLEIKRGFGYH